MIFGKAKKPQARTDSLIGVGPLIEGNVSFSGGLPIDGVVKGEIHVSPVVISGSVLGPVIADDSLKLEVGAWVKGRVSYASMEIHFGAVVESRLLHNTDPIARRVDLKLALSKSAGWVIQPCLRKPVFSEFFVFIS